MPDKLYYSNGSAFQAIAYYKFGHRKQYSIRELASYMSIGEEYAYKLIGGTKPITADIAKKIIEFITSKNSRDTELLEFFCPEGIAPVPLAKAKLCEEEREKDQIHLSILNGEALKEIEEAFGDGVLDKAEARKIEKALNKLQAKAAELREKITKEVRG